MSIRSDFWKRIHGEHTSYIPWFGDLSYYYTSLQKQGKLDSKYEGPEGEVRFYRDRHVGICFYAPQTYCVEYTQDVTFEERTTAEGIFSAYHTKYGTLESVQKYLPSTFSFAYTKHFVETLDDLQIMAHIFEHMRYHPNYEAFRQRDALYGEDGLAVELAPVSVAPIQKLLARWAGISATVDMYVKNLGVFEDCLARIEQAQMPVFDVLAGSGAPLIEFPENISSEVTGFFFDQYNLPYYQKVIEILHRAGKVVSVHIDGTLKPCLGKLHTAGFDIAEAVTPAPVGDVALEDLRQQAGDEIFLWGGLPGVMFTPVFTDAQFEEHIHKILTLNDNKMILGVADQVPPDAIDARIREVSRLIGRG